MANLVTLQGRTYDLYVLTDLFSLEQRFLDDTELYLSHDPQIVAAREALNSEFERQFPRRVVWLTHEELAKRRLEAEHYMRIFKSFACAYTVVMEGCFLFGGAALLAKATAIVLGILSLASVVYWINPRILSNS